jgi:GTP-binding protein
MNWGVSSRVFSPRDNASLFVDYAEIELAAGDGGKGAISFHREKYVPKGGPDGGNGGRGGDIFGRATTNFSTLLDFRYKRKYQAPGGQPGGKNNRSGESGQPLYIDLPVGTVVTNLDTGKIEADLNENGKVVLFAKGGKGGRGNESFKSSTNRTPRYAEDGQAGERLKVSLELKSIADVGLVGLPNAGKSTLLSRLSAARPRIADYPFTTKVPNLGIVPLPGYRSFVMADIPGLIEGAHAGKGMGIQFLRHIQRTRIIIYLLDISSEDPAGDLQTLRAEMISFDPDLVEKSSAVAFNKIDLIGVRPLRRDRYQIADDDVFFISAATGENVDDLLNYLAEKIFEK